MVHSKYIRICLLDEDIDQLTDAKEGRAGAHRENALQIKQENKETTKENT